MFGWINKVDFAALEQRVMMVETAIAGGEPRRKPTQDSNKAFEAVLHLEAAGYQYNRSQGWHKPHDAYREMASRMFGVPYEVVTPEQREEAKRRSFYERYGR